jgi:hypothetical protein
VICALRQVYLNHQAKEDEVGVTCSAHRRESEFTEVTGVEARGKETTGKSKT